MGDRRSLRWCVLVKKYELHNLDIHDKKMKELVYRASKDENNNVRIVASEIMKRNNQK